MRVAHHFAIPPPPKPELDAAIKEARVLIDAFGGEINHLYPGTRPRPYIRPFMLGAHQLGHLIHLDRRVDLHHIHNFRLRFFPALLSLNKPVLYSLLTSLPDTDRPPGWRILCRRVRTWIVPDEHSRAVLCRWGVKDAEVARHGIDIGQFSYSALPYDGGEFFLLAGSAPWTLKHFHSKGVDLLLDALTEIPELRLVFLWRGTLLDEMKQRVRQRRVADRVEIIDHTVDVNEVLRRAHASVVLAQTPQVVKAFPNSLMESLAAGKPVLVSRCLAISRFVEDTSSGRVLERFDLPSVVQEIKGLMSGYLHLVEQTAAVDRETFSLDQPLDSYRRIYTRCLKD